MIAYKKITLAFVLALLALTVSATKIEKGIKLLNEKQYTKAKDILEDILADYPTHPAALYGMARYFAAEDNPAFNYEKGYEFVIKAQQTARDANAAMKKEMGSVQIGETEIVLLKEQIEKAAYNIALKTGTLAAIEQYLNSFHETHLRNDVLQKRNALAYADAEKENTSAAYDQFLKKYPDAAEAKTAKDNYDLRFYQENTNEKQPETYLEFSKKHTRSPYAKESKEKYDRLIYDKCLADNTLEAFEAFIQTHIDNIYLTEAKTKYERMLYDARTKGRTIEEFQLFINQYPSSPFIPQAEEQIYLLAIKGDKTPQTYYNFIQAYPNNRYIKDAWQMIEQMEINYSDTSTITLFLNKYKNYPNASKLQKIMLQYQKVLYPVKAKNGKWGFMDETGKLLIAAGYEKAQNFNNGLAMVQKEGKFGYINKGNTIVIPTTYDNAYDFKGEFARVRANKMWGMINRKGEVIIPINYDDISDFNAEGLAKVKKGGKWGLVDRNNRQIVEPSYDQILDFVEGLCLVRKDDTWLYIDKYGVKVYCAE